LFSEYAVQKTKQRYYTSTAQYCFFVQFESASPFAMRTQNHR
jgi:hypothetical protein